MDNFDWVKWAETASRADLTHSLAGLKNVNQNRETQKLLQQLLDQKKEEEAKLKSLPDCPFCGNKLPKLYVKVCGQCRHELAWVENTPCDSDPAIVEKLRKQKQLDRLAKERRVRAKQEAADRKKEEAERRRIDEIEFQKLKQSPPPMLKKIIKSATAKHKEQFFFNSLVMWVLLMAIAGVIFWLAAEGAWAIPVIVIAAFFLQVYLLFSYDKFFEQTKEKLITEFHKSNKN